MSSSSTSRASRHRGVMLVEILLALAITGIIAAGVASLLLAVAGGTKDRQDLRRRNVRADVIAARVDGGIRSSSMVLGRDTQCLVLWITDSKKNGSPDLSELRRIEWNAATKQLRCYQAPATLADAGNTNYDRATTDFVAVTAALRGTASFPATVWANGVSAWSSRPDPVTPQTRLVSYDVTIDLPSGGSITARSAASLRGTPGTGGNARMKTRTTKHPAHPRDAAPAVARRGLVLPLVLMALAIAIILGMCFLTSASTATTLSTASDHRLRARMIAESGLAVAFEYVKTNQNWRTDRVNGVWVATQTLDGGTFTLSGYDGDHLDAAGAVVGDADLADDATDPVLLTCVGVYGDARHVARAVRHAPKAMEIAVNERIDFKDSGLIDSYRPELGPYDAATATSRAVARSNGLSRQPYIKLRHRAQVNGNVYFGPGGIAAKAIAMDPNAVVTGTTTALPAAVVIPDVSEPAWPIDPTGVIRSHSSGVTTITSDLWCDRLDLSGAATLRIIGNVNLYVTDTLNVTDDAKIQVGDPMAFGAAVKGAININTSVPVDSYDSSLGPYGGSNRTAKAVIATNLTTPAAITVGSTVRGDVYAGPGAIPATAIIGSGNVTGTRGALPTAMTLPAPVAMPGGFPPSSGHEVVQDLTYTLTTDHRMDSLKVTGNGSFRISGHRRVRVDGDFTFDGNAVIDIPANASLTMYIGGTITIDGNAAGLTNTSHAPARLQFIGTGSGKTHRITNNAALYATIDAPTSAVRLDGNVHVYGAIMAASLDISGNAGLHNDRNPAMVAANPRLPATWTTDSKLSVFTKNKATIQRRAMVNAGGQNPLLMSIRHSGAEPLEVKDNAFVFADGSVPEMTLDLSGDATWNGRIYARDLKVGGTAEIIADASSGVTRPGVVVEETVEIRDNAIINGTGGTALLASHGATDTTIRVTDTAAFRGDGYTAPGGSPTDEIRVAPTATFTGTKAAQTTAVPIAAPPAPPITVPVNNLPYSSGTTTLTGDVPGKTFDARGNATINVTGNTRLILTGDFKVTDRARILLAPDASLTVFCAANVVISGQPRINLHGNPGRVIISAPAATKIEINDKSQLCGTLLAPLAELKLKDTADLYGAFAGRRLIVEGNARVHCPELQVGSITWLEQQ